MEINLDINNYGLYTERNYKQTVLSYLATLLGSIFGIMGAYGGVMRAFESSIENLKTKLNKRADINQLNKERLKHKEMLGDKKEVKKRNGKNRNSEAALLTP